MLTLVVEANRSSNVQFDHNICCNNLHILSIVFSVANQTGRNEMLTIRQILYVYWTYKPAGRLSSFPLGGKWPPCVYDLTPLCPWMEHKGPVL